MPDKKKVIKGVHDARKYFEDREWVDKSVGVHIDALNYALSILKEQEAEPLSHMTDDSDLYFTCGKCGHVIWSEDYKFCPMCATRIAWNGGRSVKWNERR